MSNPRRNSGRLFVRCGSLLCVLCVLVAGAWLAGWLPAGVQVTLDHFAANVRAGAQPASAPEDRPAFAARPRISAEQAEQEMRAAGEQFEPEVAPRPARTIPDAAGTPIEDKTQPIDASTDPVLSPASRQRLAQRRTVRQIGAEEGDDPFAEPRVPQNRALANANFEEEVPSDVPPVAAATKDAAKPAPLKQPGAIPPPQDLPGDSPAGLPEGPSKISLPASPPADRTAFNAGDTAAAKGAMLMDMKLINSLIEANDLISAQRELSRWYWKNPSSRGQIRKPLEEMAQSLYFSPQPLFHEPYVVQPGDQLRVVAQRYKLSWEYIAKLNRVDARKIRMGQKLKVVDGPFSAIISLSSYELIVHLNGSYVKSYRVGVGKEGTTPIGTFTVKNKLVDPTYFGPDGMVVAHDDPQNPLGERWIDIGDSYGIHGTIDPGSIGKNESRGCIRLLNPDVEELYDLLVLGSQVKIQK